MFPWIPEGSVRKPRGPSRYAVDTTMASVARLQLSYVGLLGAPAMLAPPWIQNLTGNFDSGEAFEGTQMLRKRLGGVGTMSVVCLRGKEKSFLKIKNISVLQLQLVLHKLVTKLNI